MTRRSFQKAYAIEVLDKKHHRRGFTCGVMELDGYLKQQALQDTRRNVAAVFVAVEKETDEVFGFYTLSMSSVVLDLLPKELAGKLPRYPTIPAVRLGRLAVSTDAQGKGLGKHLLMDAVSRALENDVAWYAFVVDAKDDRAREFYLQFGFLEFNDSPYKLFVPRKTLEPLFS